ncbi:hypothetical protein MMC13_007678 [Lambiella insularis]|nr:hypothetical protein [Lambiella insularis]
MNNDASSSTSDRPHHGPLDTDLHPTAVAPESLALDERKTKVRLQQAKRASFLDDLIRNLDIMIYCELSALYYLDASLFRFFLRALPQFFYFTPKPSFFPPAPPNRPYIATILFTNSLNLILHIFSRAPAAGEAMRGYIHGALLIDFVGELGPISKTRMVALDLATMLLQFVILAVVLEREALKKGMEGSLASVGSSAEGELELVGQDHDAEEQGVHRSAIGESGDIELRALRRVATNADGESGFEALSSGARASASEHPLDVFNSGQHVVANLHVIETIRTSYRNWLSGGVGAGPGAGLTSARSPSAVTASLSATARGHRLSRLGGAGPATATT